MRNLIDIIGKQVWVLVDNCGHGIYHIDKSSKREVVGIVRRGENFPDGTENTDWYDHLVLRNEDGTSTHIKEYEAVICPENYADECSVVSRFLRDNRCYADEVWQENEIAVAVPRLVRFPYGLSWLLQNRGAGNRGGRKRLLFRCTLLHQGSVTIWFDRSYGFSGLSLSIALPVF